MAAAPNHHAMALLFILACFHFFSLASQVYSEELYPRTEESLAADGSNLEGARLVMPTAVLAGSSATLLCLFEAEENESPLYAVKWYRGSREFYRYVPREKPPKRYFAFPGIVIDLQASDRHQVTLRGVPLHLSGSFSCEVSLDAPKFTTVTATGSLLVLEPPAHKPIITISPLTLVPGQTFKANCTAASSKVEPKLEFYINNKLVPSQLLITWPFGAGLQFAPGSELFIATTSIDKVESNRMTTAMIMTIRCVASVSGVYRISSSQLPVWLQVPDITSQSSPHWHSSQNSSSSIRHCIKREYIIILLFILIFN